MPWCPKCRTEYREGFTICADCGSPLTAQLPPLAPSRSPAEDEPVLLTTISNEQELELFTSLLHEQRIPFYTQDLQTGEYMRIYMGFSIYGQEVYVRRADYLRCVQLFRQLDDADFDEADMEAAYDDYMLDAEPEESEPSDNGGYRLMKGFLLFFIALIVLLVLISR